MGPRQQGKKAYKEKEADACPVLASSSVFSEQQTFLLDAAWSHIHLTFFQSFKVCSFWFGFSKYYQVSKDQHWRALREALDQGSNCSRWV